MLRRLHYVIFAAALALAWPGRPAVAQTPTPAATAPAAGKPAIKSPPAADAGWRADLDHRIRAVDARFSGELGVHVQRLDDGAQYGFRANEIWYLASGVKVPIAIAVLREVEQGWLTLDTQVTLLGSDIVDGAGRTNAHRAGDRLTVAWLLDQMIVYSDNTASDMLIRTVGLGQVNRVAAELIARDVRITTLADVRRLAYGMFHPGAAGLRGQDMLALQRAGAGQARVRRLAQLLGVTTDDFLLPDLDSAFESYYATHANSGTLRDFGRMLAALQAGEALEPESTRYLLDVMARVQTGKQRIRAGLPADARFAHKTGTQYRRICDAGIASLPTRDGSAPVHVVIAACARGASTAASERAMRELGAAVTASGVLDPSRRPHSPTR
ncbi:serine hydrolase [Luteimonas sp. 3794]|uniref:serine hydrolase n=1 Tax=Luteimonas sp. 3794 TaxID=2817730 RepID=UPI00285456C5|nr:serine hydrolase [Luteimonas sp. 3794]MDR6993301.1 beta-lactamase class A [Luteimonas sp. 3794]